MRADDDGFVANPKRIMRIIGSQHDDYNVLLSKGFIIIFKTGVCVIKHWRMHNLLRGDRYTETNYLEEKRQLAIKDNGSYTELSSGEVGTPALIAKPAKPKWQKERQKARSKSSLPDSFDYKIRQAFVGKPCPICRNEMRELPANEMKYNNPMPSIRHNIPISKGGKHELGNISVICISCNVATGDRDTGEYNAKEVMEAWNTIGNQSAPQVRLGKDSRVYNNSEQSSPKEIKPLKEDLKWQLEAMEAITLLQAKKKSSVFKCFKDNPSKARIAMLDCKELGKLNELYFFKVYSELKK